MRKIGLMILCQNNDGKNHHTYVEFTKLLDCTRFLNTFKPKRGYEIVKVEMSEAEDLFIDVLNHVNMIVS